MTPESEYRLIKKFYRDGIILRDGVKFNIISIEDDVFQLEMYNPKNISYTESSIKGHIHEKFVYFYEALGINYTYATIEQRYSLGNIESMYVSPSLEEQTNKIFKSITNLNFEYYDSHNIGTLKVKHLSFNYEERTDREGILLFNNARVLSASKNGEPLDILEAIDEYERIQRRDKYRESEISYVKLDRLMEKNQLFCDGEWQVFSVHTNLIY